MITVNNYSAKTEYPWPKKQKRNFQESNDLSFGSKSARKQKAIFYSLAGLFFASLGVNYYNQVYVPENEKKICIDVGWNKNIRVMASNGQNLSGLSSASIWGGNESYSKFLTDKLKEKGVNTLEQANDSLAKNGYESGHKVFYSLETPGKKLNIFNKNEKNKDRFVFVCAHFDSFFNIKYENISDDFIKDIQKTYKIPKENIIQIASNSKEDFLKGIDSISAKIDRLKNKKNAELLVYYTGHGAATAEDAKSKKFEGAMEGHILPTVEKETGELIESLDESTVKEAISNKIRTVKTLFILDTCHAGAWIAENTQVKGKKTLNLLSHLA